ncbi:alpha/beta hydrolase, partial [Salmonella enterica subsp. enterica]|nr:alpha/beta hydrolase [Salmonella enterica subsp. enterica serovar Enteritidis]
FHKLAFTDWGPEDAEETVICVHGLTRQGRDFDALASRLAKDGYRVVCPDLVGRGRSGWLPNLTDYVFPQYCADMGILLASLHARKVHWVGTSLGGLIGMALTASERSPIASLVINDIGPEVPPSASWRVGLRLASYGGPLKSMQEAEAQIRKIYAACGDLSDAEWRQMTVHSFREENGRFISHLDPKVRMAYQWFLYYRMSMWQYWRAIDVPVLLVHGAESDFVPARTVRQMEREMPHLQRYLVPDAGHMPSLMVDDQIEAVRSFLKAN